MGRGTLRHRPGSFLPRRVSPSGADVTVISGVLRMTALPDNGKSLPGSGNNELESFKEHAPFDASVQVADERNIVTTFDHRTTTEDCAHTEQETRAAASKQPVTVPWSVQ